MASAPPTRKIEFRTAAIGTTVVIVRETRPDLLADELHKLLGGRPDFFNNDPTVLDFGELESLPERVDWSGLSSLFRRFQLQPIGVLNLDARLVQSARQAGFAQLDDAEFIDARKPPPRESAPPPKPVAEPPPPPQPAPQPRAETLFVDRPVRSGQQIYARGGDLVLLEGMSNGAEVIADGSIHCYGPLRGRAVAGAQGDASARIITTNFGPELVSIAGVYKTFENGIAPSVAAKPALIRLTGETHEHKLGIAPLRLD